MNNDQQNNKIILPPSPAESGVFGDDDISFVGPSQKNPLGKPYSYENDSPNEECPPIIYAIVVFITVIILVILLNKS